MDPGRRLAAFGAADQIHHRVQRAGRWFSRGPLAARRVPVHSQLAALMILPGCSGRAVRVGVRPRRRPTELTVAPSPAGCVETRQ